MQTKTYNHGFAFGFSVENHCKEGNASATELRHAIMAALSEITDAELVENCGVPLETYLLEDAE